MYKNILLLTVCSTLLFSLNAIADEFDESALFSDTATLISLDSLKNKIAATPVTEQEKTTVGFSGEIASSAIGAVGRDKFTGTDTSKASVGASMIGNLMLDVRLPMDIKAFANLEAQYAASNSSILMSLREIFIDFNFNKRAYLRVGKQVLQWGRCNFWNPTDLINVEKKLFIQKIGYREGAYGLRAHIPFGTRANIYGFIDAKDARSFDSLAVALKAEVLFGGTEMSLSVWDKNSYNPVLGFDISTSLFNILVSGEVSVSKGENAEHVSISNNMLSLTKSDTLWNGRACIGLSKSFEVLEVKDRLTVALEGYYVSNGSKTNYFADKNIYALQNSLLVSMGPSPMALSYATPATFLELSGSYEQNSFSPYYAALMANFGKFIISDLTLTGQSMMNISQKCVLIVVALSYANMHNVSASLTAISYVGPSNTEYTYKNQGLTVLASAGIKF